MSASEDHQKLVDQTIAEFKKRGIECIDFEKHVGETGTKRPDLWLPDFHALVEVKTFAPQKREIEEEQRIAKELSGSQAAGYWHPLFVERFSSTLAIWLHGKAHLFGFLGCPFANLVINPATHRRIWDGGKSGL